MRSTLLCTTITYDKFPDFNSLKMKPKFQIQKEQEGLAANTISNPLFHETYCETGKLKIKIASDGYESEPCSNGSSSPHLLA